MSVTIHFLHPSDSVYSQWADEAWSVLREEDEQRKEWILQKTSYSPGNGFVARDIYSVVCQSPGPIICVAKVERASFSALARHVRSRWPIREFAPTSSTDLYALFLEMSQGFLDGEPTLPSKFVIAILVLRKLNNYRMWKGNSKGYMWAYNIPKNNGVPEKFQKQTEDIIRVLSNWKWLVVKPSGGKPKYALNPDNRVPIMKACERLIISEPRLFETLTNPNQELLPARLLDDNRYPPPPFLEQG